MSFFKLPKLTNTAILRSIGIYTFTNFFSKAISFLLLFIYTNPKYISPSENGLLSLLSNSLVFIMPFIAMGSLHSVSTDFFKLDKKNFSDFFTTSLIMPVIVTLLSFVGLFIFKDSLQATYGFPPSFVWIIPLIVFFTFCYEHLTNLIRNNNEPNKFLFVNLTKTFIELSLSVVLVVFFAWRWQGRLVGIFSAAAFAAMYAFYYFVRNGYLFGEVKKQFIYNELLYALPIIVMQASLFCLNASDKFFLAHFTNDNNATVGVYSVAYTVASVVLIFSTALLQYIYPKIYGFLAEKIINYNGIKKHFSFYFFIMAGGTLLLIIMSPLLYKYFINEKYNSALQYIYIICIGNFLWSINYFFYAFFFFDKQKRKILIVSISSIMITCTLNYFLIKNGQAMGAAVATCGSYLAVLIITLLTNRIHVKRIFFDKP